MTVYSIANRQAEEGEKKNSFPLDNSRLTEFGRKTDNDESGIELLRRCRRSHEPSLGCGVGRVVRRRPSLLPLEPGAWSLARSCWLGECSDDVGSEEGR